MNRRTVLLLLLLCLGLTVIGGVVWAQTAGFGLPWSAFNVAGTGAEPLTSNTFQLHASLGQPGPVGSASSASFGLTAGYQAAPLMPVDLDVVGHLGDDNQGIQVRGNYAYTTFGREIAVLDVSNPAAPTRVGYLLLPSAGQELYLSGDYAYVLSGGLRVIDVSDPADPTEVGYLLIPGWGKLHVVGTYVYAINNIDGFHVVDVSDPSDPREVGACNTMGGDVFVSGSYAYVAGGGASGDLLVLDISDPADPRQVGLNDTPDSAWGVFVAGSSLAGPGQTYAYVADYGAGPYGSDSKLRVMDLSNPTQPQQVGVVEIFGGAAGEAYGLYVSGSYAYVSGAAHISGPDRYGGVAIVDISNPAQPQSRNDFVTPKVRLTRDVFVSGGYAFLTGGYGGLRVVSVADPSNPAEVGAFQVVGASDIQVSGTPSAFGAAQQAGQAYAYLADLGLKVVDLSDPVFPTVAGVYEAPPPGGVSAIDLAGNHVYAADFSGSFRVLDVSDPANPTQTGSHDTNGEDVAVAGSYAYLVGLGGEGLRIMDVSDPANPIPAGSLALAGETNGVYASGSYLYVATSLGLSVLDISNPALPAQTASLPLSESVERVHVSGGSAMASGSAYAYLAGQGLWVVDVSNPAAPSQVGFCDVAEWTSAIYAYGDLVYVAGDDLWVVDVSDPARPTKVGFYDMPWGLNIAGVYADGSYVYIVGGDLTILRVGALQTALQTTTASVVWLAQAGGPDPASRSVGVKSTGWAIPWTATVSPAAGWLETTPLSGTTPQNVVLSAHISGLSLGRYETSLIVASGEDVLGSPQTIPVTLIVAENVHDLYLPLVFRNH